MKDYGEYRKNIAQTERKKVLQPHQDGSSTILCKNLNFELIYIVDRIKCCNAIYVMCLLYMQPLENYYKRTASCF